MITIEVKPSIKLKEKEAMFISFPYSLETVNKVKSLPTRYYTPANKSWEVPMRDLDSVLALFQAEELKIVTPKATSAKAKKAVQKVEQRVQFVSDISMKFRYKTKPFTHQVEAFEYSLNADKFLLGDEQGLGKTKQSIDIAVNRKLVNGFKHCLIICGVNSVKHNWLKEIRMHSNEQGHILGSSINTKGKLKEGTVKERLSDLQSGRDEFFLITNIETLRSKEIAAELEKMTTDGTIGMVIIDEIHKAKNPQSAQGKAIHSLKSYFKLALTGTPLMNQPLDLYNTMKWLDAEKASFFAFRNRYCQMGGFGGYEVIGYKNLSDLRERFSKTMLRRTKNILDLPPKIRQTEYVEMTAKQDQLYREIMRGIKANIQEVKLSPNPLAQLIRLRQATAHTGILSKTIQESAKIERLKEMLEEIVESGKKAIIFSNWTDVTERVLPELKEYNPAIITGKTKDRQEQVEKFQNDDSCKVILGTIGAMGTGLTLTAASTVFFLDSPWNMANKEQAEDRAHRIGTKGTVNIVTLICKDTIDERIEEIISEKAEMSKGLVEGDEEILAKLGSPAELIDRLLS